MMRMIFGVFVCRWWSRGGNRLNLMLLERLMWNIVVLVVGLNLLV